ncbi:MAG: glucokinase [Desulfobulbaceae bacterium]|nr:glucokinase [Desulfobulbaceae bacterium]
MSFTGNILLAGDVGGTKTTLALHKAGSVPGSPLREQTFINSGVERLEDLIGKFLHGSDVKPKCGCFGVAGPVLAGRVQMTNLDWIINAKSIEHQFGLHRVDLINDLVATAMGAIILPQKDLQAINEGTPIKDGAIGVVAPGTGLGEAFVFPDGSGRYHPKASEGGHADFAPRNRQQINLLQYMLEKNKHVSVEQVCSGMALPMLFKFLRKNESAPSWLIKKLQTGADHTPIIIQAALDASTGRQPCDIAVNTMHLFTDILAAEAANLALKVLAVGGIYIGGGLPPRILPFLDSSRFMSIFKRGVYREMLGRIPVHIILNPKTALIGAAAYGFHRSAEQEL